MSGPLAGGIIPAQNMSVRDFRVIQLHCYIGGAACAKRENDQGYYEPEKRKSCPFHTLLLDELLPYPGYCFFQGFFQHCGGRLLDVPEFL